MAKPAAPTLAVLAALVLAPLGSGCGKSPESFCKAVAKRAEDDKQKKFTDKDLAKCTKDMAEVKKASPKGYDCMTSCLDLASTEALFICVGECGDKDEKLKDLRKKQRDEEEVEQAKALIERAKLKEKTFDGSVTGWSDQASKFTITLVEGFKEDTGSKSMQSYEFVPKDDDEPRGPHITVMSTSEDNVEDAAKSQGTSSKILKKDKRDSGFAIHAERDGGLSVTVMTKAGEAKLECTANLYNSKAAEFKDDLLPWLDKLCSSVKPEFVESPYVLWTKLKPKKIDSKLKDYSDKETGFSIELAEGFKEDGSLDTMKTYSLQTDPMAPMGPMITISPGFEEDLDKAAKSAATGDEKVTKKTKTSDGFLIVTEGENTLEVETMVKAGETKLECKARVYGDKPKEKKDVILPWLEKICGSLKVKS